MHIPCMGWLGSSEASPQILDSGGGLRPTPATPCDFEDTLSRQGAEAQRQAENLKYE